jgi:hypothetical protein
MIKWRRVRFAGHVSRMGQKRGANRVLVGKSEGRNHIGVPGVDGRIILKLIFEKRDRGHGVDRSGLGHRQVGGLLWKRSWTCGFHKIRTSWGPDSFLGRPLLDGVS